MRPGFAQRIWHFSNNINNNTHMCAVCLPILFFKYFSFVCKKNLRKATKPQFMFSVGGCKVAEGCVHVYVFVYISTCTCQCIRIYIYICKCTCTCRCTCANAPVFSFRALYWWVAVLGRLVCS